ncbi:MAG: hypothetical protein AAF636_02885 [Pseudomonadota bacterium]
MTDKKNPYTADADVLLRAAAQEDELPAGLMQRVLADAANAQLCVPVAPHRAPRILERLIATCGGWQGMGGLVAASCAGFWIGVSPPAALPDAGSLLLGGGLPQAESSELAGFGWDIEEG